MNLLRRLSWRLRREERGQAVVESAIVIPLMTFLILGIIQLVMMQHAKVMTDYAAFNAARAGIVWNADRGVMENAAVISLLPTYDGLLREADIGNPTQMLRRVLQRALLYQLNRRLAQSIDLMRQGVGQLIGQIPSGGVGGAAKDIFNAGRDQLLNAVEGAADHAFQQALDAAMGGGNDLRMVQVEVISPSLGLLGPVDLGTLQGMIGGAFVGGKNEIDFDDPANRETTRLTIRVRYLYMLRVPFANWVIHQAWLVGKAGAQLYGAIWNPQQGTPGETGFRNVAAPSAVPGDALLRQLDGLGRQGVYMVPLISSYSMRMQSNPYKAGLQVK